MFWTEIFLYNGYLNDVNVSLNKALMRDAVTPAEIGRASVHDKSPVHNVKVYN